MSKVWKEVRISVCAAEQTVAIYPDPIKGEDVIMMRSMEEDDKDKEFLLYLSPEEAEVVADELMRLAQEMKSERQTLSIPDCWIKS